MTSQLEKLNSQQLDEFILEIFNWQQPEEMERRLCDIVDRK
jgi:hypothetical protein